tara:strand:- start:13058 stop:13819 length:762 start_codon:yes stop_codon:yes gene_type:complete
MNFFFCLDDTNINSKLTIPKFQNEQNLKQSILLFSLHSQNNKWILNKTECDSDCDFFYIKDKDHIHNTIYFLAQENDAHNIIKNNVISNINKLTDTNPAFRANLEIENEMGGFSSYQSDYPFDMIKISNGILSPLSILLTENADINKIYFRNIFFKPTAHNGNYYIINKKQKKILEQGIIETNKTNIIHIKNDFINEENYFFTSNISGIPIYFSQKNNHISFEHTHPPHQYILSEDKYSLVKNLKKNFNEIIN